MTAAARRTILPNQEIPPMCIGSKPNIPAAVAQPVVQDVKQPNTAVQTSDRRKAAGIAGGSLLTGPSGAAISTTNVGGANSFLGT